MGYFNDDPKYRAPGRPAGDGFPSELARDRVHWGVRWGDTQDQQDAGRFQETEARRREMRDLRHASERPSESGGAWGEDWRGDAFGGGGGYGGYDPQAHDANRRAADADIRESRYGYRGERRAPAGDNWRDPQARESARHPGRTAFGGGYLGTSDGGDLSYSGAQRVDPGNPGYRQEQAGAGYRPRDQGASQHVDERRTASLGSQRFGERSPYTAPRPSARRVGPKGFQRSDERICDDLCDRLSGAPLDVSDVSVDVKAGVVTLSGTVPRRQDKYMIEEIAEEVFGVDHIENALRLARDQRDPRAQPEQRLDAAPHTADGTVEAMRPTGDSSAVGSAGPAIARHRDVPGAEVTGEGTLGDTLGGMPAGSPAGKERSEGEAGSGSPSGTPPIFRV